jgi:hypothetical protein
VARASGSDSPVYQLVDGYPNLDNLKPEIFQDRVIHNDAIKAKLAKARSTGLAEVMEVDASLGDLNYVDADVVVDLFLSYRTVKAWQSMIELIPRMSLHLANTVLVQEQLGLALNRAGKGEDAERVLLALISNRGGSGETYGILGRIYKDRWEIALRADNIFRAKGLLDKAISAYLKGFEADCRNAYPGINAVTLMELKIPVDPRQKEILPVVSYVVDRQISMGRPNYWDFATRLEVAILSRDKIKAEIAIAAVLAQESEAWQRESTSRNLTLIMEAWDSRSEDSGWVHNFISNLCPPQQR